MYEKYNLHRIHYFLEYLLGEDILVAPVLDKGATSRDIYLPKGEWQDALKLENITGPIWLRNYTASLSELPYFTRILTNS